MKITDRFKHFFSRLTKPSRNTGDKYWWLPAQKGAGVVVTYDKALQLSACFACVRVIAEDIAKMPWHVFRKVGNQREKQDGTQLDRILNTRPNPEMGAMTFRKTLMLHAQTWGNGYAEIERDMASRPVALWIIEPWRVTLRRRDGMVWYEVTNELGSPTWLPASNMFHITGMTSDGLTGIDMIANAALTLGFGIAAEQHGASFYGNNTTVGTSFKTANKLSDKAYENITKSMAERKGSGRAFEGMVLEEGLEPVNILMKQTDAQYLETRRFQVEEVCRYFRVPPHKIFDLTNAHFSNVEQFNIIYVNDSLMPWIKCLEEEADYKLTSTRDPRYTRIAVQSLLRGDLKARGEWYRTMFGIGAFSQNKILEFEDMDPVEGGDERFMQSQMVTVKSIIEASERPPVVPNNPSLPPPTENDNENDQQSQAKALIRPVVANMLRRFWDQDKVRALKPKQVFDFQQYCEWANEHLSEKIKSSREKAVLDNIEAMEMAYSKTFDLNWILKLYNTWATSSLVYFYKDELDMIDVDAFVAYFLQALSNANQGEEPTN